jgi:hypothetical protein
MNVTYEFTSHVYGPEEDCSCVNNECGKHRLRYFEKPRLEYSDKLIAKFHAVASFRDGVYEPTFDIMERGPLYEEDDHAVYLVIECQIKSMNEAIAQMFKRGDESFA